MIVVDTNIISYFYIHSNFNGQAERIHEIDSIWAAPRLWRSEFRNVLISHIRKKRLTFAESIDIFKVAELLMKGNEYDVSSSQVIRLSHESGCSAYDCEYVYLARHLDVRLITEDKKIIKQFPDTAVSMTQFINDH